jgi:hypothetical protein
VLSPRNWIFATAIAVATMSAGSLQAQAAATICKDGTSSVSSGRGACSGHGGVNKKAMKAQKKAAKAEVKAADKAATAGTPKASAKAKTSASSKSAVAGSGAGEDNNPAGAIARCKDGLYSHAKNRRGACSRHGGVASWS